MFWTALSRAVRRADARARGWGGACDAGMSGGRWAGRAGWWAGGRPGRGRTGVEDIANVIAALYCSLPPHNPIQCCLVCLVPLAITTKHRSAPRDECPHVFTDELSV